MVFRNQHLQHVDDPSCRRRRWRKRGTRFSRRTWQWWRRRRKLRRQRERRGFRYRGCWWRWRVSDLRWRWRVRIFRGWKRFKWLDRSGWRRRSRRKRDGQRRWRWRVRILWRRRWWWQRRQQWADVRRRRRRRRVVICGKLADWHEHAVRREFWERLHDDR